MHAINFKRVNRHRGRLAFFGIVTAFLLTGTRASAQLSLISPADGSTLQTNMPLLSWKAVSCDHYLVYVNEIRMDQVAATQNSYTPFPLSFGENHWKIVAVRNGKAVDSASATFSVDDKPLQQLPVNSLLLRHDWRIQSALLTPFQGQALSSGEVDMHNWNVSSVPATALTVLVRNGIYPNPYTFMNNRLIPDLNDSLNAREDLLKYSHIPGKNPWKSPYWYVKSFVMNSTESGKKAWLTLNEINYRAEIWLNGHLVADTSMVVGMERSFRFEVGRLLKAEGKNHLAIAIFPPDHPGLPVADPLTPLADPGQNMADGMISRDYTKWDVLGWDWQPPVRDRDMGITEDVFISFSNGLEIDNLYVTSDLPLPDTNSAGLTASFDIVNDAATSKNGMCRLLLSGHGENKTIELPFDLQPGETRQILLDPDNYPALLFLQPALWWPAGHGKANLYDLQLELVTDDGTEAVIRRQFGIRELGTYIGKRSRVFCVNGKDIFCKAGNWVIDMMLNWNARRYEDEILLSKQAGLNLLRVWGPTGAPPQALYDAADRHGIMIWQDFLNDFWGTFKNTPGYQPEAGLFEAASTAIIKKYRNHPSLVIWCGGNEGVNPREDLLVRTLLPRYDGRGQRHYLTASDGDGLHGGGPYHTLAPEAYFEHHKLQGFSSEIGPSGIPVAESIGKFMPLVPESWAAGRFPLDGFWAFHDANNWPGEDTRKFSAYDDLVRQRYGVTDSAGVDDVLTYLDQCQLVNYEVYKASIEAVNRQMWTNASGIALWKSNSSWPSLVWQVYDWYLQAHAGNFAAASANEAVHVQYNRDSRQVVMVNNALHSLKSVRVSARLFDIDLNPVWQNEFETDLAANTLSETTIIVPVSDQIRFLVLQATGPDGALLSRNFYWLYQNAPGKALDNLPTPMLTAEVKALKINEKVAFELTLTNDGSSLAFMVALSLRGVESGMEILPAFWSDNYLNILPGETQTLTVWVHASDVHEKTLIQYRPYKSVPTSVSCD